MNSEGEKLKPCEIAQEIARTTQCNCDLDNWEPEKLTGHSWVCRIHKLAIEQSKYGTGGQSEA